MTILSRIWRGIRWSEKYGSHPGNVWMAVMAFLGLVAGGVVGSLITVVGFLPIYLIGAYQRGK